MTRLRCVYCGTPTTIVTPVPACRRHSELVAADPAYGAVIDRSTPSDFRAALGLEAMPTREGKAI